MTLLPPLPLSWNPLLRSEVEEPYFQDLSRFLTAEAAAGRAVLPAAQEIFAALDLTPYEDVRVVLLGQDPYPTPGDAHGLCFSVRRDRPVPRSLRNIYRELAADIPGFTAPDHGNLESWARQGMLLLNTVLTVRPHEPQSHRGRGWETFTDRIIAHLNRKSKRVVFLLWGNSAHKKRSLITGAHHAIVACAHPSPLSARLFFGCRCFSAVNRHLEESGQPPILWKLPA
ncbi:MAG TPA: uracil-DNA glycosylase [Opitutaceae bacterium]|nr:uracil-DNA glycosylase [Opitutaceae bacterium]